MAAKKANQIQVNPEEDRELYRSLSTIFQTCLHQKVLVEQHEKPTEMDRRITIDTLMAHICEGDGDYTVKYGYDILLNSFGGILNDPARSKSSNYPKLQVSMYPLPQQTELFIWISPVINHTRRALNYESLDLHLFRDCQTVSRWFTVWPNTNGGVVPVV